VKSFTYRAICPNGTPISGVIEARDHDEARQQIGDLDLQNVTIEAAEVDRPRREIGLDDFLFFNEQFASLAEAGVALDRGLRELAKELKGSRLRRVVESVADDLERGLPIDEALGRHEKQLPILYGRVVRAGMERGQLSATLMNLSHHLRLLSSTRRLVIEALAYPAIVAVCVFFLMTFLLRFVVPQMESMFRDFDVRLPALTLLLFQVSRMCGTITIGGLSVIAIGVVAWRLCRFSEAGRRFQERTILAIPVFGDLIRNSLLARFLRSLALSISSGLPLPEALRLSAGATGSPLLCVEADRVGSTVENGSSLHVACESTTVIPPMMGYATDVAIEHGNLEGVLLQLAKAYEMRAWRSQATLREWLIPIAILVVGFGVGVCIVGLLLPLVSLVQSVSS